MTYDGILLRELIHNLSQRSKIKVKVGILKITEMVTAAGHGSQDPRHTKTKSYFNLLLSVNWEEFFNDFMTPHKESSIELV